MLHLKYELKKKSFLFPLYFVLLFFFSALWKEQPTIVPFPEFGFIDTTEVVFPLLCILPISFLLYNDYEIELGLTNGMKTVKLMSHKFLAVFIYSILSLYTAIALFRYCEYLPPEKYSIANNILPDNYKFYMLYSSTVTLLLFSSVTLFFRVLTRNYYIPIGIGLIGYILSFEMHQNIRANEVSLNMSLYDPFISSIFLGDEFPLSLGLSQLWTYNRLLFLSISIILLFLTYLILRREHLHESFMD